MHNKQFLDFRKQDIEAQAIYCWTKLSNNLKAKVKPYNIGCQKCSSV